MSAVFISYSRHDQAFVRRLHAALDALGRDAWVDWQGIAPTAEWMAEIRRGIDGADAVLFVISPSWLASEVCSQELEHAVQQGKRLVPVVCLEAPAAQVPAALAKLNWIFLREGDNFDDGVRRLVAGLDVDLDWVREHTRLIERAQEWQASSEDEASLLRGRELDEAERWLAAGTSRTDPAPVPLQARFVTNSREAARRRQRIVRSAVLVALVVAIGLAIWATVERGTAVDNALAAEQAASAARFQEGQARKNEARAVEQEGIAKVQTLKAQEQSAAATAARDAEAEQRKAAQSAQREAERQRDEAVRQRIAAQSRQLAARAEAQPAADPALLQKAALLAAESLKLLPNVEADQVLRRAIERLPVRHTELPHAGIIDAGAVASDGPFVAFVDTTGLLRVIHTGRMQEIFRYDTGGRTRHVHVDRAGRYVLLTSARDGTLLLFTNGGTPRRIEDCDAVGAAFGGRTATQLAIGCHRQLRLIDASDPTVPARTFEDADGSQLALDFRRDSEQLAGVDDRGTVTVWNVADGRRVASVPGQDSSSSSWSICCTAFIGYSASGSYIAANNRVGERLHVVSTTTWKTHAWLPHGARVNVFAFDEQGDLMASGDINGRITVWDLAERAIVARMSHADGITGLRLYANPSSGSVHGPALLSASTDRTARVWHPFSGAELTRASQISPVIWVDRPWEPYFGRRFVTIDNRTGLVQWDMRPPGPPMSLGSQRDRRRPVSNCAAKRGHGGQSGPQHWIFDADGLVGWDPSRPVPNSHVPFVDAKHRPFMLDPDCRWLAVSSPGELRIVDPAASGSAAGSIEHPLFVDAIEAGVGGGGWWRSPRGAVLALRGSDTGLTRIWRTAPWARLDTPADCKVGPPVVSPDERSVALRCGDGLRIFDLASGRETARLEVPGAAGLTDDGRLVLRDKQALSVRQLPGGRLLGSITLPESLSRGAFAIDRHWVAVASDNAVGLWRVPTLRRQALLVRDVVPTPGGLRKPFGGELSFSPDGRHLLVHGLDRLHVFDTEPWALRAELIHPGSANLVQWDVAARRVIAQVAHSPLERDLQHGVRAWHIDSGAELLRIPLQRAAGMLSVSGDGRFLLADQVYRFSSEALLDTACRLVARNLTAREWQAEFGALPYQRTCPSLPEPAHGTPSWDQ